MQEDKIKVSKQFVGQTGTLSPFTLLTPSVDMDLIATVYVENVTGPATSTVSATLKWTDNVQQESVAANAATTPLGIVQNIHAVAGQPVTIEGTDFGNSQTYNIFVTLQGFTIS